MGNNLRLEVMTQVSFLLSLILLNAALLQPIFGASCCKAIAMLTQFVDCPDGRDVMIFKISFAFGSFLGPLEFEGRALQDAYALARLWLWPWPAHTTQCT
jgi:hypothetical protein